MDSYVPNPQEYQSPQTKSKYIVQIKWNRPNDVKRYHPPLNIDHSTLQPLKFKSVISLQFFTKCFTPRSVTLSSRIR